MPTKSLTGLMLILGLAACTNNRTTTYQPPQQPGTQPVQRQQEQPVTAPTGTGDKPAAGEQTTDTTSSLPIVLTEQQLKSAYGIEPVNLSYNFEYLNVKKGDAIRFDANGAASITIPGLPSKQKGN